MENKCYYCGNVANTDEHVPPRAIFPELKDSPNRVDYRKNPIIVPSCEVHNTQKCKEDEYLLYFLVMSLPANEIAKSQFLTKVSRAIKRRPGLMKRLLCETKEVTVHDAYKNEWNQTYAIKPEEQRLTKIFTHIAKAIYYYERKNIWEGQISIVIEFMLSFSSIEKNKSQEKLVKFLDNFLKDEPHKGEHPDVFSYQWCEVDGNIFIRLCFYGSCKVTMAYSNNGLTIE
jgi:hypothetical protein